jgi:hypothetical protein
VRPPHNAPTCRALTERNVPDLVSIYARSSWLTRREICDWQRLGPRPKRCWKSSRTWRRR